jgi:hypothetical protein
MRAKPSIFGPVRLDPAFRQWNIEESAHDRARYWRSREKDEYGSMAQLDAIGRAAGPASC